MKLTHTNVSFVKSVLRMVAGGSLVLGNLVFAGIFLIAAEVLGILEEIVEDK